MQNFDFNEALKAIQSGKPISGQHRKRKNSTLRKLVKYF